MALYAGRTAKYTRSASFKVDDLSVIASVKQGEYSDDNPYTFAIDQEVMVTRPDSAFCGMVGTVVSRRALEHRTPENEHAAQRAEMTLAGWVTPLLHDYKLLYEALQPFMGYRIKSHPGEHVTISVNNDDLKRAQALKVDDPCRDWGDCS